MARVASFSKSAPKTGKRLGTILGMAHPLESILGVREEARSLSDVALIDALLKPSEANSDVSLMVKNVLAAEAIERGMDADDPIIDFPSVLVAGGEADLSVMEFLPEEMRERAMQSIVKGESLPLEIVVANHGFELRLKPTGPSSSEKPSITHRIRSVVERVLGPEDIEKRVERRGDQWCVVAETSGRNMGCYDSKEAAEERLAQIERFSKAETFSPPKGVRSAAKRALEWIADGEQGSGFTMTGRARASQLARGESVSLETVKRMHSYFSRHKVDARAEGFKMGEDGYPSPGRVAWDAWGGDAGARWAASIVERVAKNGEGEYEDDIPLMTDRQKAMYVAYERIAEMLGPWNGGAGADGAHYMEEHPFVSEGIVCGNCAFYEAPGGCEILNQKVNALGVCKLWIIPEALVGAAEESETEESDENPTDALADGQQMSVEPADVPSLMVEMAKRDDDPDLTELNVNGTNLFGDDGLGYERSDMPQIPPDRRAEFMGYMQNLSGIGTSEERVDPRTLRPTQREISGRMAGQIFEAYKEDGIPDDERIIVTEDDYVIDGHHTWAAAVGIALGGGEQEIPVYRIAAPVERVLGDAHSFVKLIGSEPEETYEDIFKNTGSLWFEYAVEKNNPYRDRSSGRFTFGPGRVGALGGAAGATGGATAPRVMLEEAYPGATGGYRAGIPTEIGEADSPVGEKLDPSHSLWHHLERNPDWDGRDPQQQYRVTPERQRLHEQLINDAVGPVAPVPPGEEKIFVMLGGGPAAGKSSGLDSGVFTGVPSRGNYVEINPDGVKEGLPEYDPLRLSGSRIEFKAAAGFVHEESSMVAKMQQHAAIRKGTHVVVDGTGDGKPGGLQSKVGAARAAGYTVRGRYATISSDEAWSRAVRRSEGPSRRYVNEQVLRGTHRAVTPSYINAANTGLFDDISLIWTGGPRGSIPVLVHRGTGGSNPFSFEILDAAQWADFEAKGL